MKEVPYWEKEIIIGHPMKFIYHSDLAPGESLSVLDIFFKHNSSDFAYMHQAANTGQ